MCFEPDALAGCSAAPAAAADVVAPATVVQTGIARLARPAFHAAAAALADGSVAAAAAPVAVWLEAGCWTCPAHVLLPGHSDAAAAVAVAVHSAALLVAELPGAAL